MLNRPFRGSPARTSGFSLLEILVALVIVSIGILGIAGLQASALKYSRASESRSVASLLALDMLERLRVNSAGAKANEYSNLSGFSSGVCNGAVSSGSIAYGDTSAWLNAIACALPQGQGKITIVPAAGHTPSFAQVEIQWDESRLKGGSATQTFTARTLF